MAVETSFRRDVRRRYFRRGQCIPLATKLLAEPVDWRAIDRCRRQQANHAEGDQVRERLPTLYYQKQLYLATDTSSVLQTCRHRESEQVTRRLMQLHALCFRRP